MKTSKEAQLLIADKVKENIENEKHIYNGIQVRSPITHSWVQLENLTSLAFSEYEFRFEPQTITINGVEIPKPLTREEFKVRSDDDAMVYYPKPHSHLYGSMYAELHDFKEGDIFYGIPSIAIEASKLLFGIKD